jgi:GPH family glycoside/pentoside/hexuronide:cation symporter
MKTNGLSLKTKLGFGVCDLGGNLFFTIMGFYIINFVTDVALLGAALAGTALWVGKIWDACIDPAIGYLSDRTKSRLGRRRPWMLGGAVALFFFMIVMYTNPHIQNQGWLFVWLIVTYCLLVTAYSVINIPYGSLTPELTRDYDGRTVLNAYRMSFAVLGTFIGFGLVLPLVGAFANKDTGWTFTAAVMGAIITVTALITIFTVKEPARAEKEAEEQQGFRKTYAAALKNRPFVLALLCYAFHITGISVVQGTLIYYFKYIYGGSGSFELAGVCLLVPSLLFIPIWTMLSRKIGKKWCYNIGMGIVPIALLAIFLFAADRGPVFMYIVMAVSGIGLSTNYVMPFAIIPDAAELDYAENGVRREGAFYGLWNFALQIGQAFALALSGWILAAFGYVANIAQTESSKLGIRLLVGPVAAVFFIAGIVALSFYPISRKYYDTVILPKVAERDRTAQSAP